MFLFLFRWFGLRHQQIHDIKAVDDLVRRTNQNTFVVVASTVATPLYQRPIKLTADIVVHSLTKFINGHLDVVMGSLMLNREDLFRKILKLQDSML